jgi:type II secretion system protein H
MRRPSGPSGFTLVELVLVMIILTIALGLAVPTLRGWSQRAMLRDEADRFLALTVYARSRAVAEGRIYRIAFSDDQKSYQLTRQSGMEFEAVESPRGDVVTLPRFVTLQKSVEAAKGDRGICFYPTGRTDPAMLQLSYDDEERGINMSILIDCPTPTDRFQIVAKRF